MTREYIRNRFAKNGYKVVVDLSGVVMVSKMGITHSFNSLNSAYKHYFSPKW